MLGRTVIGRFAVTILVLLIAFLLLTLKNKVLVGSQSLTAELSADGDRLEIEFVDVAGTSTLIGRDEEAVADIKQSIYRRLSNLGSDGKPLTDVELDDITVQEERAVVEFDDGLPPLRDLQRWLETSGYELPNPDRALFHINLGIDLRGGVEFTTRLFKNGVRVGADATTVEILRKRLDSSGLVEPQVYRLTSGDVQVVIPGGTESDAARTRSVLETTGQLEVRKVKYYLRDQDVSGDARTGYTFAPGYDNPKAPWEDVVYPLEEPSGQYSFAHLGPIAWSGEGIASANVSADQNGEPAVSISLDAEAAPKNEAFTTRLREELVAVGGTHNDIREQMENGTTKTYGVLAISLDGVIRSNPYVKGPSVSQTQISGSFTQDEAKKLVTVLRAGALKVTPRVISERVVGPSLGKETIDKGTTAMLISMLVVLASMLLFYRKLGSVAIVSLVVTVALIFVVLSIFGATLTLPGLAGLVLTVGMAVDANILIFERLREELAEDVDLASGIDKGYGRAFITILDANLTTFITALILYWIGAGPVKGFGLTLMIGILTSMFGALYVGRMITEWLYRTKSSLRVHRIIDAAWFRLEYTKYRKLALTISCLVALGTWAFFFGGTSSLYNRFGNDFTGGFQVQVTFQERFTNDDLVGKLRTAYEKDPEGEALLNPDSLQILPYYSSFDSGGDGSPQWVLRGRDEDGARLEGIRAEIEDRIYNAQREIAAEQTKAPEERDQAKLAELREVIKTNRAKLTDSYEGGESLNRRLQDRQEVFRRQLKQAMGDLIDDPGSELAEAHFADKRLTLAIKVLGEPDQDALDRVAEELARDDEIASVSIEPAETDKGEPSVRLVTVFRLSPHVQQDVPIVGPEDERLAKLLQISAEDDGASLGRFQVAQQFFRKAVQTLGDFGVAIDKPFPSAQYFSPTVGAQMMIDSLLAMLIAIVAILAYVAARFEFRYGIGAIVALVHDVLITIGLLSLFDIRIDLNVVAALLTIVGYSLNDTMVVFDRIRENIRKVEDSLINIVNLSISQTMGRTLLTSFTTMVVVGIILVAGGEGLADFSATLLIGLVLGTYSSVFVAAPVLVMLNKGRPADALLEQALLPDESDEPDFSGGESDEGATPGEPKPA